ncbi:MAG: SIMPL domain-containing protein [Candidatus Aquilonibacter sp.]
MKRIAILAAAMLLAPIYAKAQVPPERGPMSAVPPQTTNHGITVSGSATTRVPATSARITLSLSSSDRSLTLDAQSVQPIVDALVKAGADPASVRLPLNFGAPGGSNVASITATVAHPTSEMMQSGIVTVGTAVASMKNVILNGAMVFITAAHCQDALDSIRNQAIERARAKADSIAKDLDVHVGGVLNVMSNEQNSPDGSCSSQSGVNGFANNPADPQSPQDYVTVPVFTNVTITYAIK